MNHTPTIYRLISRGLTLAPIVRADQNPCAGMTVEFALLKRSEDYRFATALFPTVEDLEAHLAGDTLNEESAVNSDAGAGI